MPNNPSELKASGLKATLPRLKILEIFQNTEVRHLSAEDVYKMLLADNLDVGLATHHVASADLGALAERLATDTRPVDLVLAEAAAPVGQSPLLARRAEIDRTFDADSVDAILEALAREGTAWAEETIGALEAVSRQSLDLTLDLLRRGAGLSLRECLDLELRAAAGVTQTPDFIEGVRAVLVDKDRTPHWGASRYRGITAEGDVEWTTEA